jgi:hypothetical protein
MLGEILENVPLAASGVVSAPDLYGYLNVILMPVKVMGLAQKQRSYSRRRSRH